MEPASISSPGFSRAIACGARWARAGAIATILAGCGERGPNNAMNDAGVAIAAAASDAGTSANPLQAPANPGRSDPACLAPLESAAAHAQLRPARGQLVLGVMSGFKDASDDNLTHLRALASELRKRGAELLIADGDLGDNSGAQEEILGALAGSEGPPLPPLGVLPASNARDGGVTSAHETAAAAPSANPANPLPAQPGAIAGSASIPILVLAGNRELRTDLDAAEAALRKRGAQIFDLSHTRAIDLGDALIVGVPGVFERRLLRADGACLYTQADLDALAGYLDKLPPTAPPALLVAAVPPHGEGAQALDFSDAQNLGELRFIPLLTSTRARFGVFGQVWEAGGRAVDGQGHAIAPQQPASQLYVNPGAADRTPWPMDDGSTSRGQAILLTLRGRQASFDIVREPAPSRPP